MKRARLASRPWHGACPRVLLTVVVMGVVMDMMPAVWATSVRVQPPLQSSTTLPAASAPASSASAVPAAAPPPPTGSAQSSAPAPLPEGIEALLRDARAHSAAGDTDAAALAYQQSLDRLHAASPNHPALAEPLNELAMWHVARGEASVADTLLARAQRLLEAQGKAQELALARVLGSRGVVNDLLGRDADARALNDRALDLYRAHESQGAPVWIAEAGLLNAQAGLVYRKRRLREAEPLFLQALERLERAVGPADERLLPLLDNLQALYRSQGRPDAGSQYANRAQAIRRGLPPS